MCAVLYNHCLCVYYKQLMKLARMSELRANMRDRGYSFVLQNQKIYNNELLSAQSINHISLRYTQDSVKVIKRNYQICYYVFYNIIIILIKCFAEWPSRLCFSTSSDFQQHVSFDALTHLCCGNLLWC